MFKIQHAGNTSLSKYLSFVQKTDRLPKKNIIPVLHGLYGEVGSLMTAAKKLKRENKAFAVFEGAVIEEFGDTFWYLCCMCIRLGVDINKIFSQIAKENNSFSDIRFGNDSSAPLSIAYKPSARKGFDEVLIHLGQMTGAFLGSGISIIDLTKEVKKFLESYFSAISILNINFWHLISKNMEKASGRFIRPKNSDLPDFDKKYKEFERLPEYFEIEFVQRTDKHQAMRWNGVFIGDPLTDSIKDIDGYRFHDVFHFSHAAILHWSPTFRALIKHKRKSDPLVDEAQDGGRAIVVEEGLTAWIFAVAKHQNFFKSLKSLSFDMLKTVQQFVSGFDAEQCPLILWEEAILNGYNVFRNVRKNDGGIVIGNRKARTIIYKKSKTLRIKKK